MAAATRPHACCIHCWCLRIVFVLGEAEDDTQLVAGEGATAQSGERCNASRQAPVMVADLLGYCASYAAALPLWHACYSACARCLDDSRWRRCCTSVGCTARHPRLHSHAGRSCFTDASSNMQQTSVFHMWFSNSRSFSKSALLAPLAAVSRPQHALPLCMHRVTLRTCVYWLCALILSANFIGGVW